MSEHTYKGCTITIHQDDDAESPREYDNLGTMVCCHGRYNLGDRSVQPEDINPTLAEFGDDMISLPLYLYDHSGITMNTTGFSCPWDSGQVGRICVSRERVVAEYGKDYTVEQIESILRSEVEEYDKYIRGEVYGYEIQFADDVDPDSCWGFIGYDHCMEAARDAINCEMS